MTCDTENKVLEEAFNYFCLEIQPKIQPYSDALNKKLIESPLAKSLDPKKYFIYLRTVQKNIDLYREENIPLQAELSVLQQQYGQITGAMMITVSGKEYTLQQAGKFLESSDRSIREEVYHKIQARRLQDKDQLDELFNKLLSLRAAMARNAGFDNYRDYRFRELGRFDYSKEDCFNFHDAVKQHVLPLVSIIHERKRDLLKVESLCPWDLEAEPAGMDPLRPFSSGAELLEKSMQCFKELNPFFGNCLEK